MLEQTDLLEVERRGLLMEFGKEAIRILSTAKDHQKALALIEHLRRIYFVGYEEQEQAKVRAQADELIRLGQLAYRVVSKPGGVQVLEVSEK
jgi:hypothetical protein